MASIFDQYEQASQRSKNTNPVNTPLTNSGYISMQLEDDVPMFSKQKMHFVPSDVITHVAVSSDFLVLAMANNKLFSMDLSNPSKYEEIHFGKYMSQQNTKLSAIFLDPLGFHILLSFSARTKDAYPELMYLHRKSTKLKPVSKSKNYEVTEVGWNFENTSESTTGSILLGTSHGLILETEIGPDSDKMFQTGIEQYWRQVFDIGKGTETPITGVQFHKIQFPSKYFVIVTTPKRLYQFIGYANKEEKPMLQSIFNSYLNVPETGFQDIPSTLKYSKLQLFHDKVLKTPKQFAWLTGPGIFYGKLDPTSQENSNSLFTESELINYPPLRDTNESPREMDPAPVSFVLTEFHALILYSNHVKAISLLNKEVVYEDYYSEAHGKLKNIVKDPVKQSVWVVTDKGIFKYKIIKEDRYVWQIYCEKEMFDLAKQYCGDNPAHIDSINVKQAELLFKQGDFEKSASTFADTQSGFEGICLKFLQADKIDALKIYLMKRLHGLGNDEKILITMIVVWVVELFLSQLAIMRRSDEHNTVRYKNTQSSFDVFLNLDKVKKCIKGIKHVIYDLMSSHCDQHNLMKLTELNEDYENVISQNIYEKNYLAALDTLKDHCKPDMYYQFCPILLQEVPKNTVNVLIWKARVLSPTKLLPGLISCDHDEDHANEIIRYLEYCVQSLGCKDRAIHNYLVSLYAEHRNDALMRYLARQGQDLAVINFDVHYALRLCQEKQLTEACVKLSALLGLWESAIDMAITVNLDLAKSIANMIEDDLELKKKLWLKIAQHELNKNQDVKRGMEFLKECDLIKIEDILPFFSDVVTIDHFRDPICVSLQEYNQQIEDLKIEMEEATRSAEQVRADIQSFRYRSVIVGVTDVCALCDITLLLRPFYLFPCGHRYHSDCLMHEIQPILSPARRNKLSELQRKFHSQADANALNMAGIPMREELKNSIDDIVASECLYCGEYMIQSIDKPFIAESDWDRVMKEWE